MALFRPNPAGLAAVAASSAMADAMAEAAEAAKGHAEVLARAEAFDTGEYAASFAVEADDDGTAVLVNTSEHAAAVEWGEGQARHILSRAADWVEVGES